MNININDVKNGMTIIEGNLCLVLEFQHVKPGKGQHLFVLNLKI